MDTEKLESTLEQPAKVTSDGESVENRSVDDTIKILDREAHKNINRKRGLPIRFGRFSFPGSVY